MRCVPLILENVFHCQNTPTSCVGNFLETLKATFGRIFWLKYSFFGDDFLEKIKNFKFPSKKYLWPRTGLIQNALCSPDLGECFTYPEHVFKLSRKFSGGSQSQKLPKKRRIFWGKIGLLSGHFCQNPKFLLMLQYKMIDVSYGSDSKCAVLLWSRRWFYSPRSCFNVV